MADKQTLTLDQLLCFSVYSTGHAFNRIYKPLLDRIGLTYPQYLVMVVLWQEDGQTVRGIGSKLFLESNTLTPLLKRLESAGLLKRERDRDDERQVRVMVTQKGRELQHEAQDVPDCVFEACGLDMEALSDLNQKLITLRNSLEKTAG
ncbi:MarR family winged helix-turn-helix transcriptional regulator [Thalassospira sp. TSL5-1]|uniref:MarR family winged helix-turn-helix transcriptional regulator n=1 Tax=Thalassospira sp. TSL5-1 TaxID=1544451 RepID=UPI00093A718C|nr:MarR family transcriptional regulator [Thalassospira sp. TSL5-1]OKH89107.1 MarR family transcriptional regulator [Thalassospira sp. TSL5-1]